MEHHLSPAAWAPAFVPLRAAGVTAPEPARRRRGTKRDQPYPALARRVRDRHRGRCPCGRRKAPRRSNRPPSHAIVLVGVTAGVGRDRDRETDPANAARQRPTPTVTCTATK